MRQQGHDEEDRRGSILRQMPRSCCLSAVKLHAVSFQAEAVICEPRLVTVYLISTGNVIINVTPSSGPLRFFTWILPLWLSIIRWTMASPRPVPDDLVVKNGLKIFAIMSCGIDGPVLLISIISSGGI